MVATAGRGRILMWEGASLWLMEALPAAGKASNTTDFHAHHAVQITLSLGGRFELRTSDRRISANAAVAPDVSHIFEAVGPIAILFVEPESRPGRAMSRSLFGETPLAPIPSDLVMDLIERRKLWFSRADKFEDPLEGTFTDAETAYFRSPQFAAASPEFRGIADGHSQIAQTQRATTFVNCWREGKFESMAMWDIYGKGSGVVAIKSTVGLLKEAFATYKWNVFISRVKYIDWNAGGWEGNALTLCCFSRPRLPNHNNHSRSLEQS